MYLWRTLTSEGLYDGLAGSLRSEDLVLDIGANIGLAAIKLVDRCPAAHVIAVEPAPASYGCLQEMLKRQMFGRANLDLLRRRVLPTT
jgi:predicted O-methyltransferase YrrM